MSEEQEKTLQMMKMILPGYTQDAINKQRNSVSFGLTDTFPRNKELTYLNRVKEKDLYLLKWEWLQKKWKVKQQCIIC